MLDRSSPLRRSILICAIASFLAGCYETRVVNDPWAGIKELADPKQNVETRGGQAVTMAQTDAGFAILLETFEGDKAEARAARRAKKLMEEAKLPEIWIRHQGAKMQLLRGRYPDPTLENAQSDLRQTRMVQIDGTRPYEHVDLVSLRLGVDSSLAKFDLKQFSGQSLYSVQVAAFDPGYGEEFRKAAENYAQQLRDEGEQAYFYHGPNLSMVTIGLFGDEDFPEVTMKQQMPDGSVSEFQQTTYGPRIREVQARYPHNLLNGYTIRETVGDQSREQPSFAVPIR